MTRETAAKAAWDGPVGRLTDRALTLAAGSDDATKAALRLTVSARLFHVDRLALYAGARYRLAGVLDRDPTDLVALAALGIVTLAALEGPDGDGDYGGPPGVARKSTRVKSRG